MRRPALVLCWRFTVTARHFPFATQHQRAESARHFESNRMSQQRRVVITGMGVLTPVGNDIQTFWNSIRNGVSGIGPITRFDAKDLEARIAGEVLDFDPLDYLDRKEARRADRFVHFAVATASAWELTCNFS